MPGHRREARAQSSAAWSASEDITAGITYESSSPLKAIHAARRLAAELHGNGLFPAHDQRYTQGNMNERPL